MLHFQTIGDLIEDHRRRARLVPSPPAGGAVARGIGLCWPAASRD